MKNGIREKNKIVLITTITLTQASKQASNKFPLTHPGITSNIGKRWQTPRLFAVCARFQSPYLVVNSTRVQMKPGSTITRNNTDRKKIAKNKKEIKNKSAKAFSNQPDTRLVYSRVRLDPARNRQSHEICFKEIPRWWSIIRNTRTVHVDTIVGQKVTILPAARQQGSLKEHAYIYTRVQMCAMCAQVCARLRYVWVRGERGEPDYEKL